MRIYQVYNLSDMADSDSFFATRAAAMEAVRSYGCKGRGDMEDGVLSWETDDGTVCLEVHDIEITRAGVCRALKLIPNR